MIIIFSLLIRIMINVIIGILRFSHDSLFLHNLRCPQGWVGSAWTKKALSLFEFHFSFIIFHTCNRFQNSILYVRSEQKSVEPRCTRISGWERGSKIIHMWLFLIGLHNNCVIAKPRIRCFVMFEQQRIHVEIEF